MTIHKGQPWGQSYEVPLTTRDVDSDWQLARGSREDIHILKAGDLYETLGQPSGIRIGDRRTLVHIDAMECTITNDNTSYTWLASATVEIGRWNGLGRLRRYLAVTNGGLLNGRHIAPRAHPNDGLADLMSMDASMTLRDRIIARKRARTGAHIPHPAITVSRGETFVFACAYKGEKLVIDHHRVPTWNSIEVQVRPDYWQVIV
jgi:hypothetical protein